MLNNILTTAEKSSLTNSKGKTFVSEVSLKQVPKMLLYTICPLYTVMSYE